MNDIKCSCPNCSQSLEAPPELAGQAIECPSCKTSIEIPLVAADDPRAAPSELPPPAAKQTKPCPFCGEEILKIARKCKHCGEFLDATARPAPPPAPIITPTRQPSGTFCPTCQTYVTPVVTSVGGGSCSFGKRETWKCPSCTSVLHRSGCFVATATYGDEDFVEVKFLRAFRDGIMSRSRSGRVFIWIYYRVGPYGARMVEQVPRLKPICRKILDQIVDGIEAKTYLKRSAFRTTSEAFAGHEPNNSVQRARADAHVVDL